MELGLRCLHGRQSASLNTLPDFDKSAVMQIARWHQVLPRVLVQLPVTARLDRRSKPYQGCFLEMAADQHQADRQSVDAAAWHREGRMPRDAEGTGVGLHVERHLARIPAR